jgi:GntR family transcriptional repressor for pyruvate dehydrogenase complex
MSDSSDVPASRPASPTFTRVQRKRTFEKVFDQLEAQIVSGKLRAGDRLPNERALSEMLGVSRASLREALRILEGLQIIEVKPGSRAASGALIASQADGALTSLLRMHLALGHFQVDDLAGLRRMIEPSTAREAATRRTPTQLQHMTELLARMRELHDDPPAYMRQDALFHIAIADAAANALVKTIMEALRDPIVYHITDAIPPDMWDSSIGEITDQHGAILAAIEASNSDDAEQAIIEHLAFYRRQLALAGTTAHR